MALAAASGACSSSAKSSPPPTTAPRVIEKAGPNPSVSAKMICATEAKNDIAASVGIDTVKPFRPTWSAHRYACDYIYKGGAGMTLSVKEMSSAAETTAYFDDLAPKLGRVPQPLTIGDGAYPTRGGTVVVRKDYRVLVVDVSHLPARFGKPLLARADFAQSVASIIMDCWTGA